MTIGHFSMKTTETVKRFFEPKTAAMAFVLAPLFVLMHELAHIMALELGGISAHLRGFSMAMPVGYFWDFQGLAGAQRHYDVATGAIVRGALAGPVTTLFLTLGGLIASARGGPRLFWIGSFCAIAPRMLGLSLNMPRFIDGTMNTSDEAIAAHFSGLPLSSLYWPSLAIGYGLIILLFYALPREERLSRGLSAFAGGLIGYLSIDAAANWLIFQPDVWVR